MQALSSILGLWRKNKLNLKKQAEGNSAYLKALENITDVRTIKYYQKIIMEYKCQDVAVKNVAQDLPVSKLVW